MHKQSEYWSTSLEEFGELRAIVLSPPASKQSDEWLLLCHGFGASAEDLFGLADPLVRRFENVKRYPRMIFPDAPIDMTDAGIPGGRAWWPLNMARLLQMAQSNSFDAIRNEVPPGLDAARVKLVAAIDAMCKRFSLETHRLILGGFSQGAMLAADTIIRGEIDPPERLVLLSGAMICQSQWQTFDKRLSNTRVYQSHGRQDTVLPIQTGRWLHEHIQAYAKAAALFEFDGGHTIPVEAIGGMVNL